jgi:hypothetical protein
VTTRLVLVAAELLLRGRADGEQVTVGVPGARLNPCRQSERDSVTYAPVRLRGPYIGKSAPATPSRGHRTRQPGLPVPQCYLRRVSVRVLGSPARQESRVPQWGRPPR